MRVREKTTYQNNLIVIFDLNLFFLFLIYFEELSVT